MKEKGRKGVLGKAPVFKESLKIAVAREYLAGQLSFSQIAKKHQLPSGDTARYFLKWYKQWLASQGEDPGVELGIKSDSIHDVEHQLQQANLRITALEMLIQNAETELGIDITKKSGTKQPTK